MQNSNKQCKQTIQHPRDKPLKGAKYIKHHNLKCSLKSTKVNRDLNAVVLLDVTVELGKAFHSDLNTVVTLDVTVELGKAFHSDLNAVVTLNVTVELGKAFHSGNNLYVKIFTYRCFTKRNK